MDKATGGRTKPMRGVGAEPLAAVKARLVQLERDLEVERQARALDAQRAEAELHRRLEFAADQARTAVGVTADRANVVERDLRQRVLARDEELQRKTAAAEKLQQNLTSLSEAAQQLERERDALERRLRDVRVALRTFADDERQQGLRALNAVRERNLRRAGFHLREERPRFHWCWRCSRRVVPFDELAAEVVEGLYEAWQQVTARLWAVLEGKL